MVASTHWLASSAGMAVLESGGNAFDAAVAAGLTLQVVEPHLNGPGGEVPIIFHSASKGETFVLSGQGPTPAAANIACFEELGLELVPGTGLLAACVPGAFDAWMVLLGEFGTLRQAVPSTRRTHRSEEHTSELQSHSDLPSFPTRRSSDLGTARRLRARCVRRVDGTARRVRYASPSSTIHASNA